MYAPAIYYLFNSYNVNRKPVINALSFSETLFPTLENIARKKLLK